MLWARGADEDPKLVGAGHARGHQNLSSLRGGDSGPGGPETQELWPLTCLGLGSWKEEKYPWSLFTPRRPGPAFHLHHSAPGTC